ncbi:MAG TPA: nucleotidyltransferase [Bacteroidia bacterium]|nr:nucleotidyltransferase [Bacteroidia bacterium]
MNIFDSYTFRLLSELNKLNVQYLVVGGYAVNYYGYRRTTGDIDLWIKPENEINKKRLIDVFRNLGVGRDTLKKINELDFTQPVVFIDGEEPFKIDFMTYIASVKFDEAWQKRVIATLDEIAIPFIHFNHLILSKISTGREKDKIDVEKLQEIQKVKKKNK